MKKIELNLLGHKAIIRKEEKIKFSIIFLYVAIWCFSIFILINIYTTNSYMYSMYRKEAKQISSALSSVEPKFSRIQFLYNKYKRIESKENIYRKSFYRPGNCLNKMILISEAIPDNITLDQLSVNPNATSKKDEKIKLSGVIIIDEGLSSLQRLNRFKNNLESNTNLMKDFTKVEINENKISRENKEPMMSFIIRIF